ncbi:MAG TPA: cell wall-binding repeat-containing protein, partial [Euzebya sp.]|nr:cell wall-binding repeat-containing protein [Euzebya sp.]
DALAGGAYGARTGVPVLLTDTGSLSPATAAAISDLGLTDTVVLGGTAAIAPTVMAALPDPVRLSGADRAGTAVAVALELWGSDVTEVVVANGYDESAWGWALAAAPLAARQGTPLLLTSATELSPATAAYLAATPELSGGALVGSVDLVAAQVGYTASDLVRR